MRISMPGLGAPLATWGALLVASAAFLSATTFETMFVEDGPIEFASVALWLGVALALLAWRRRLSNMTLLTGLVLALAAAAREASWHQAFTADGMSKLRYYTDGGVPLLERAVAAGVVALLLLVAALALVHALRRLRDGGWRRPGGRAVAIGIGMLAFTKTLDRAPAVIRESIGLEVSQRTQRVMLALEEGLEMALPVIFLTAAYHAARRMFPAAARVASSSARQHNAARLP